MSQKMSHSADNLSERGPDYHLFWAMVNHLHPQHFKNQEEWWSVSEGVLHLERQKLVSA